MNPNPHTYKYPNPDNRSIGFVLKTGIVAGLVSLGLTGLLGGCKEDKKETAIEEPKKETIEEPYFVKSFGGSNVLVIPTDSKGHYTFYRDEDNDGFADTVGNGAYIPIRATSTTFSEDELEPRTYKMSKLEKMDAKRRPSGKNTFHGW